MDYVVIGVSSLFVAGLTFFSGFGLGTLLMPMFALFFPVDVAVAATAVVHLANNIFKLGIIGKRADVRVVLRFGVAAAAAAFAGAALLNVAASMEPLHVYQLGGRICTVTSLKILIGIVMVVFALFDLIPWFQKWSLDPRYLPVGGLLSGFFGGLSGHQGALRTIFLLRAGLSKEAFVGTVAVCAVMVDVARSIVYGATFFGKHLFALGGAHDATLVVVGMVAAFIGTFFGSKLLAKVTLPAIHAVVGVMLIILGAAMMSGLI